LVLTYLKKSLLLDKVDRGKYKITLRGLELLKINHRKLIEIYYRNTKNSVILVISLLIKVFRNLKKKNMN